MPLNLVWNSSFLGVSCEEFEAFTMRIYISLDRNLYSYAKETATEYVTLRYIGKLKIFYTNKKSFINIIVLNYNS